MAKIVAIAGLGDETSASGKMLAAWTFVLGSVVGIFVGTLLIKPKRKRGGA